MRDTWTRSSERARMELTRSPERRAGDRVSSIRALSEDLVQVSRIRRELEVATADRVKRRHHEIGDGPLQSAVALTRELRFHVRARSSGQGLVNRHQIRDSR